jgi:hypothetical protein
MYTFCVRHLMLSRKSRGLVQIVASISDLYLIF